MLSLVNDITQNFFGDDTTYIYSDGTTTQLKAVCFRQWVEINGVSTHALTAEVILSDLTRPPAKGDTFKIGEKVYKMAPPQPSQDNKIYTLILQE